MLLSKSDTVISTENDLLIYSGRSRRKQVFCLLLFAAMCFFSIANILVTGRINWRIAFIFAVLTVIEVLRTFVMRTEFKEDRIEHRTMFGNWRGMEYAGLLITDGRDNSIDILGCDLLGKSLQITIREQDGDLEKIDGLLRRKVSDYKKGV